MQKLFESKNKVFGPVQIPTKKHFLNFFFDVLGGLCTGTKCAKKWYYSDLVPVLKVNLEYLTNKNLIFHF
jgi:hypothetical protein